MKFLDVPQSGSHAGVTHSRNRYGQYVRSRATPVNPNTSAQVVARAYLQTASAGWRALTQAQRDAWDTYAATKPRTNSLGQTYYLTGAQTYVGYYGLYSQAGLTVLVIPPTSGPATPLATLTITMDDPDVPDCDAAFTATPLAAGVKLMLETTPMVSAGRQYLQDYRLLVTSAAAAASPLAFETQYVARFGTLQEDAKVGARARTIAQDYEPSAWTYATTIVTAP